MSLKSIHISILQKDEDERMCSNTEFRLSKDLEQSAELGGKLTEQINLVVYWNLPNYQYEKSNIADQIRETPDFG